MDSQGGESKKRKLDAPNSKGSLGVDLKALLDQHSEQMRRMQSQIDGLVATNSALQARLDDQAKLRAHEVKELREKCDVLESTCGLLERSIQVLKKDVDWTYSAPDIPRSHWIEQGHDEEYADFMEVCLERIRGNVEDIRAGGHFCECLDYEDQLSILHDDALLPHFKELADAIQLSNGIRQIVIDNIELRPSALGILFPAMEGKVASIFMQCVRFPSENVTECHVVIAASIRHNHTLKKLAWISNRIPSYDHADLLIESVIGNQSIESVRLDSCFNLEDGVNGCRALVSLLASGRPFYGLDFSGNCLSGIDGVASALATNPHLRELWIGDNELNDRDAELIAQALKQNTNLQSLYLGWNDRITSAGFEKIRTAIYDPASLNAMTSCNHTCYVDDTEAEENLRSLTPKQRRNRKLYKLLATRHAEGSNARHLNAEMGEGKYTIKLVPKVLHCIERYSSDQTTDSSTPLSITFELIKTWIMPTLLNTIHSRNHGGVN